MSNAIWWIRRDLRLADNRALASGLDNHTAVLPLFILDQRLLDSPGTAQVRQQMLWHGLIELDEALKRRGSGLVVRRGSPEQVLRELSESHDIGGIYAESGYTSFSKRRDEAIAETLPLELVDGLAALPFGTVLKADGTPYRVFSAYAKTWKEDWQDQSPSRIDAPDKIPGIDSAAYDLSPLRELLDSSFTFEAGEQAAYRMLDEYTGVDGNIYRYGELRDYPAEHATSQLSPYLRLGMVSPADMVRAAYRAKERATNEEQRTSAERWLDEVIWRDFSVDLLHHFPETAHSNGIVDFDNMAWQNNADDFEAWKLGLTGYPFVDAAMRQLAQTGWMHNRLRMVVASFLVKHLLIDWRWGERWFMQNLVDGEPGSNVGGWQWVAGTGVNAAPFFRIFSPIAQAEKYDPNGEFTRRWVSELADYPDDYIHEPWQATQNVQKAASCVIGKDYPAPIVDHSWARNRALEAYDRMRDARNG